MKTKNSKAVTKRTPRRCAPVVKPPYPDALKYALCALSFFRGRHVKRRLFKQARRMRNPLVSLNHDYVREARHYIREARRAGFRGSIRKMLGVA